MFIRNKGSPNQSGGRNALGCSISSPDMSQFELLPGQLPYFHAVTGPAEPPLDFDPLIEKNKTVGFPKQCLYAVTSFSAEEIQSPFPGIHMELIFYDSTQPIN